MFVLQSDEVEVFTRRGYDFSLAVLQEGEFFGEILLFDRLERTASVRAKNDVVMLAVDKDALFQQLQCRRRPSNF